MNAFRYALGGVCGLLSAIFLVANTLILARYGVRSGTDEFESIINAAVAGSVPLALAMMPFFIATTWRAGHHVRVKRWFRDEWRMKWRRGRPNPIVLVGFVLYFVFVMFNFMGAVGSIALQKTEYVDRREGNIDEAKRMREARARKADELARISVDRPPTAVAADLDGAKIHRFWQATNGCTDARTRGHSKFCGSVAGWKRELGLAEQAEKLRAELDELDRQLSSEKAHTTSADPQSETLAKYASLMMAREVSPATVRLAVPLVWFTLLECACMFFLWLTLTFFRLGHAQLIDTPASAAAGHIPAPSYSSPQPLLTAEVIPVAPVEPGVDRELQEAAFRRFWAESTRPMRGHRSTALDMHAAYRAFAARAGAEPYGLADFTARAHGHVDGSIQIGGVTWLMGRVMAEQMGAV
jgi:hypothetical protein